MKIPLNIFSVFLFVTLAALLGMVLGGAFGFGAGHVAPDLFILFPWEEFEPVGSATVLGAIAGVVCGGCLGAFAVVMQGFAQWLQNKN